MPVDQVAAGSKGSRPLQARWTSGPLGTFTTSGLTAAAGFASGVVIARTLGPSLRGELAAIVVWATVLAVAGDLGIGFAVSYMAGRKERPIGEIWTQAVLWAAALGMVLALASSLLLPRAFKGQTASLATLLLGFSAIPFMLGASYESYLLLGVGRVSDSNAVRLVAGLGYSFGALVCAAAGWRAVESFVVAFFAAQVIAFVLATILVVRSLAPRWAVRVDTGLHLLKHGITSQVASLSAQVSLRLDQLLLSTAFPPEALGLYAIAVALASVTGPVFIAGAILTIPRVLAAEDSGTGAREIVRLLKLATAAGAPIIFLGVAFAPALTPLFFGSAFRGAIAPAQILLVAGLFQGWNAILGNGLRSLGRPGLPAVAETIGLIVTVTLLVLLLPRFGILGAAVASLLAYAGVSALQMNMLSSVAGVPLSGLFRTPLAIREFTSMARRRARTGTGVDVR